MIRGLTSPAPSLKNHSKITQKSKKTAFQTKIFFACGAPKKEGGLAALAERDPPFHEHPRHLPGGGRHPGGGRRLRLAHFWRWWFWGPGERLCVLCPPVSPAVLSCPGLRFCEHHTLGVRGVRAPRNMMNDVRQQLSARLFFAKLCLCVHATDRARERTTPRAVHGRARWADKDAPSRSPEVLFRKTGVQTRHGWAWG